MQDPNNAFEKLKSSIIAITWKEDVYGYEKSRTSGEKLRAMMLDKLNLMHREACSLDKINHFIAWGQGITEYLVHYGHFAKEHVEQVRDAMLGTKFTTIEAGDTLHPEVRQSFIHKLRSCKNAFHITDMLAVMFVKEGVPKVPNISRDRILDLLISRVSGESETVYPLAITWKECLGIVEASTAVHALDPDEASIIMGIVDRHLSKDTTGKDNVQTN